MKRFYDRATVEDSKLGHHVALDGRPIKTQGGWPQVVPSRPLAERLAAEWQAQGETIDPARFAFRDMADYAIDVVARSPEAIVDKLLGFAETDTLCYRAHPDEPLWHRQREIWDPLVEAVEDREGVTFERVSGVLHRPLGSRSRVRLKERLEAIDAFTLAALEQLVSLSASLCIGLAALEEDADGDALWNAANLEEDWQVERWGVDDEAAARRARRREAFLAAIDFARCARAGAER